MDIIIIGARADGHAGVVLDTVRAQKSHKVLGFLTHNKDDDGKTIYGLPVFGGNYKLAEQSHGMCNVNFWRDFISNALLLASKMRSNN